MWYLPQTGKSSKPPKLTAYQQVICYYDTMITRYHWSANDIDDAPLDVLLDLMIVKSIINAHEADYSVPIDQVV